MFKQIKQTGFFRKTGQKARKASKSIVNFFRSQRPLISMLKPISTMIALTALTTGMLYAKPKQNNNKEQETITYVINSPEEFKSLTKTKPVCVIKDKTGFSLGILKQKSASEVDPNAEPIKLVAKDMLVSINKGTSLDGIYTVVLQKKGKNNGSKSRIVSNVLDCDVIIQLQKIENGK